MHSLFKYKDSGPVFRIGVSASLSSERSIHTSTFTRAVTAACHDHTSLSDRKVDLLWEDDHATFDGASKAAKRLVAEKVDLVVGHFASAAAEGALPLYRDAGIALLMPAATADHLTCQFRNAFRLCSTDSALAEFIVANLGKILSGQFQQPHRGKGRIALQHDGSVHGRSLTGLLHRLFCQTMVVVSPSDQPDCIIYVGSYTRSLEYLHQLRFRNSTTPLCFTDDVVHPRLAEDAKGLERNLFIAGYAPSWSCRPAIQVNNMYCQQYGSYPATYFLETYAAMEIAFALAASGLSSGKVRACLPGGRWETVLGNINFRNGECHLPRFSWWEIKDGKMETINL